jgi:hypothetical protein
MPVAAVLAGQLLAVPEVRHLAVLAQAETPMVRLRQMQTPGVAAVAAAVAAAAAAQRVAMEVPAS